YDDATKGKVTLGGSVAAPVVLTNVANGVNQYDAVNFGQLSELSDRIGSMGDRVVLLEQGGAGSGGDGGTIVSPNPSDGRGNVAIGSGASISPGASNSTAVGATSNVGGTGGTAIGSGASAAAESSTAIGEGSSVAGAAVKSVAIGQGSTATESNTVSFGAAGSERRLVNIADGINATDGATKGQLDRAVGGLQEQINDVSRNAYSGIAAATALTMIPGVDPGKTLSFGVGGASYKGYQAMALGGEARITQNLKVKAGVGLASGGNTVGMGASYQW
ncbi:YadA family autotransporter adhesin, partial [Burkholderia sp. AW49-1]